MLCVEKIDFLACLSSLFDQVAGSRAHRKRFETLTSLLSGRGTVLMEAVDQIVYLNNQSDSFELTERFARRLQRLSVEEGIAHCSSEEEQPLEDNGEHIVWRRRQGIADHSSIDK